MEKETEGKGTGMEWGHSLFSWPSGDTRKIFPMSSLSSQQKELTQCDQGPTRVPTAEEEAALSAWTLNHP